jgi:hypothetical protein
VGIILHVNAFSNIHNCCVLLPRFNHQKW